MQYLTINTGERQGPRIRKSGLALHAVLPASLRAIASFVRVWLLGGAGALALCASEPQAPAPGAVTPVAPPSPAPRFASPLLAAASEAASARIASTPDREHQEESGVARLAKSAARSLASEEDERARLAALPPASIPVQEASLAAAICLVASAAEMNFIAPAAEEFPESVTLSTRVSPWVLLQLLSDRYRFTLRYRSGVWIFDRDADGALVSRTYVLRNTNLDSYKATQNSFNMLGARQQGMEEVGASGGLVFAPQTQKIIDDLRELVGLPPSLLARGGVMPVDEGRRPVKGELGETGAGGKGASPAGKVLYLPDSNALYVTATRSQHQHVEEYLRVVDRPVKQIRIEARFFETTHDPKLVLGMDPTGYQPNITLSNLASQWDLNKLGSLRMPDKALLGADSLRFQIQALSTDDRSKLVNNPTVVVANNREAYFSVGDEEPFVSSNSINNGASDGGFGTTQAQVTIRRIGTSVNIVPSYFEGGAGESPRIRLSVRIEVGVLKGFRRLNSVDVPVVTSQKYEYTVFVRPGETLAFGGLSGSAESESLRKVPVAGDIPVLGHVFKSRSKQSLQRNLVAYLSASLVEDMAAPSAPPGSSPVAAVAGGGR